MGDDHPTTWKPSEEDLADLCPLRARDLVLDCFYRSQRENLVTLHGTESRETSEEEIFVTVRDSVRLAFQLADGDFDRPRAEDFRLVLSFLCSRAAAWGTPPEIVERNRAQVARVIQALGATIRSS